MEVEPDKAAGRHVHADTTYYFCSEWCLKRFREAPQDYLIPLLERSKGSTQAPPGDLSPRPGSKASFTCPMHPEIRQPGPGTCPLCGMALEPVEVDAGEERDPELSDMSRRLKIGSLLAAPLLVLSMGEMFPGVSLHAWIPAAASRWIQLALATPVVLWAGFPFFRRGWDSVWRLRLNMF